MELYHYRSINAAVKEIQSCTFRFAAKEELNDPIEGYVRVYWKGDKQAWEGLFRNYICSFYNALTLYLLAADENEIRNKSVMIDVHAFDDLPLGKILKDIRKKLLSDIDIKKFVNLYGEGERECSIDELSLILNYIHVKVVKICMEEQRDHGFIPKEEADGVLVNYCSIDFPPFPFEALDNRIMDSGSFRIFTKLAISKLKDVVTGKILELGIGGNVFLYGNTVKEGDDGERVLWDENKQRRKWLSLMFDYPQIYINRLRDMIYPESFIVCFSGKNNNSTMWGNYADSHRGVCLIYETDDSGNLLICSDNSINSSVQKKYHYRKIKPERVQYGGNLIERNFFETFGRLTFKQIKSWLTGEDGTESKYIKKIMENLEAWRKSYWEAFKKKNYTKLDSWEYEDEYRIHVDNSFQEYGSSQEDRIIRYNPDCLKGIIFGINTSEFDRLRILKAFLERKVEEEDGNSDNIDFYQAIYDEDTQSINIRKMQLLKLKATS